jgi:hypothetical protein
MRKRASFQEPFSCATTAEPAPHQGLRRGVHRRPRHYPVVHAVDVDSLRIAKVATPAFLGIDLFSHTLGRGMIVGLYERPAR